MLAGDLLLVGADELAAADDVLAADDEPVDPVRPGEHEPGHGIGRAAELEPVVRQTAKSARLPGSSEPMSSRPSTAAPPRVPSRSASRAVSASGRRAPARRAAPA